METELDLFAGIAVSDYERALEWYERLLGSPPAFQPHDTESVWTLQEHGHVNVLLSPEHAGHSQVTLFLGDLGDLGDLDGFVDAAESRGIHPESRETYDNGVRKVIFRDPDGNEFGCAGAPVEE
jgi:catechol 2,3-dioxygenase-like lactoylglutathione lyase family enzyme